MRLIDYFDKGAELDPNHPLLIDGDTRISYGQAQIASHRIANGLARKGVQPGAKACVLSNNSTQAVQAVLGLLRAGCVWVTGGPNNDPAELAAVLDDTDVEVLFYGPSYRDNIGRLRERLPGLRLVVALEEDDADTPSLADITEGMEDEAPSIERGPDDIATIFTANCETGIPRGVILTNRQWELLVASSRINTYHPRPVKLLAAPMAFSVGAMSVLADLVDGATHVVQPGFDPERVMAAIERYCITYLYMPPAGIKLMLNHPRVKDYNYSSLRYFVYGGTPATHERIAEAMKVFGPVMLTGFAPTETGGPVTILSPADHVEAIQRKLPHRLKSVGRATQFARVEIMDEDGHILPKGQYGEIVVKTAHLMSGYYTKGQPTPVSPPDDWHHTGYFGHKDTDGFLYIDEGESETV